MKPLSWFKRKARKTAKQRAAVAARAAPPHAGSSYSTDQPIRSSSEDRFARSAFATRIAETITARQDPSSLVLGLFGPWGDGKTSVLYMIEERLREEGNIIAVRFNPWHFTSEEQLIRGFFETLASALGKSLETAGEKIGKALKKYGGLVSIASTSFGHVSLAPGKAVQGLGEALSMTTLDDLKVRIEGELASAGKKVVVLIDDIDRLDRDETHAVFKLVKLSAGFEYTTYLLAFDEDVVAAALGERYGDGGYAAGRAFLDKIIQVPLHLPPADTAALRLLAYEGINEALGQASITLEQGDIDLFTIQFMSGLEPRLVTPRQARLYSNALMFSLPLVKGEVNIVDFMLVEGLRIFYPALHRAIRDNPSLWLDRREGGDQERIGQVRQVLEVSVPGTSSAERAALARGLLRHLFPRTSEVQYGGDWDPTWASSKRVCSPAYFQRYFSYGVPPNDVSDRAVDEFIASAADMDVAQQGEEFSRLMRSAPAVLIRKMRQREEAVTERDAQVLISIMAPNGGMAPIERGPFTLGGTRLQMAILFAHLLRRIPAGESRNRAAIQVVEIAEPIPFAAECVRWMSPERDDPEERHLLPGDVLGQLRTILVERIVAADREMPIYRKFGSDARQLYWLWRAVDAAGASTQLRRNLGHANDEIDAFLDIYVGEAWGMDDGLPSRADFRRESYDEIAQLVDPEEIARSLRERYGAELDQPNFYCGREVPLPRRVAHQFMVIHQRVLMDGE